MTHPALTPNRTAVITGGANGIGFATAERLVAMGLNVCIADHDEEQLGSAADTLAKQGTRGADAILAAPVDVARLESVKRPTQLSGRTEQTLPQSFCTRPGKRSSMSRIIQFQTETLPASCISGA